MKRKPTEGRRRRARKRGKTSPVAALVPSAPVRLWRNRLTLVATAMLGLVMLASAGMQNTSAAVLQSTLDAHWRGEYDILVTAPTATDPVLAAAEGRLVPDALTVDQGRNTLTADQLASIRSVPGVEVAAPIGQLAIPAAQVVQPVYLTVPLDGADVTPTPKAYAITSKLTTTDGLSAQASFTTDYVILDQSQWSGYAAESTDRYLSAGTVRLRALSSSGTEAYGEDIDPQTAFDYTFGDVLPTTDPGGRGVLRIALSVPAAQNGIVTLIDPVAEKQLLGSAAGAFLDPLIASSSIINRASNGGSPIAANLSPTDSIETLQDKGVLSNVSPILVRGDTAPDARLDVSATPLSLPGVDLETPLLQSFTNSGTMSTEMPEAPFPKVDLLTAASATDVAPVSLFSGDAGAALSPFSTNGLLVNWPSYTPSSAPWYTRFSEFAPGSAGIQGISTKAISAPEYGTNADGAVTETADGYADPFQFTTLDPALNRGQHTDPSSPTATVTEPQDEAQFYSLTSPNATIDAKTRAFTKTPWPVGAFSGADIASELDPISAVPLGYTAAAPTVQTPPSGSASSGTAASPAFSGLGINPTAASALADIANAATWGVDSPIASVRVRVGGITEFSDESAQKVLHVAEAIRALGLTATVVSGSSPENVPINVYGYAQPAGSGDALPTLTNAAVVTESWSLLGAAASTQSGVTASALNTLLLAITATTVLFATVLFGSITGRREQSAVLRQLGWDSLRRARFVVAEDASVLVLLVILGAAAVSISAIPQLVATLTGGTIGIALLVSLVAAVASVARIAPTHRGRPRHATRVLPHDRISPGPLPATALNSTGAFAIRQALTRRLSSVTAFLAALFVGTAAGLAVLTVTSALQTAGSTRVATLALTQGAFIQGSLVLITTIAALALIEVSARRERQRNIDVDTAMLTSGWRSSDLAKARHMRVAAAALPGAIVACVVTVLITGSSEPALVSVSALILTVFGSAAAYVAAARG